MKISRPSPAMIVSVIALVVACAGSATAASVLVKNSSQIARNAVASSDIRNGSVQGVDIASGAVGDRQLKNGSIDSDKLSDGVRNSLRSTNFTAQEVVRKTGPEDQAAGQHTVATLQQLPAGTYAILAKTTLSPIVSDTGLGEIFRDAKTGGGHCVLDAAGDVDDARAPVMTPYAQTPQTLNMQMTRTVSTPIDVKLVCDVNEKWKASDTSIIALRLQSSTRTDVTG